MHRRAARASHAQVGVLASLFRTPEIELDSSPPAPRLANPRTRCSRHVPNHHGAPKRGGRGARCVISRPRKRGTPRAHRVAGARSLCTNTRRESSWVGSAVTFSTPARR